MSPRARLTLVLLALLAATLAAFEGVRHAGFVSWDDPTLVHDHPLVRLGLTRAGLAWIWIAEHGGNWHPLTSLSHMLDVELFGLEPAGHHATSLALHLVAAALVLGLLRAATGRLAASAFVAALFALHPLRVESVAWIAERKDVLSAVFGLAAAWAWVAWTRRGGRARYLAALALYGAGLASKPMLVSFPLALWIADRWPLERVGPRAGAPLPLRRRVLEKLPFALLALLDALVTLWVQRGAGAMRPLDELPLAARLANAVLALARYLAKTAWPFDLAVFYPHPWRAGVEPPGAPLVAGAALLVGALTWLAWRREETRAGWLGFLLGLAPVLGLVQVGAQALADRYTYLPSIALATALVWPLALRVEGTRAARPAAAAGLVVLALLAWRTHDQVRHWRDSLALFEHAVAVQPRSGSLHADLGNALKERGRLREAEDHYRYSVELEPAFAFGWFDLGYLLDELGRTEEARAAFERALDADPRFVLAWLALGVIELREGEREAARACFERALAIDPDSAGARNGLAASR